MKLEWELRNESEIKWPKKGSYLRNNCEDEALVRRIFISERLEPGKTCLLTITLKLPEDCQGQERVRLQFRLEEAEGTHKDA